MYRAFSGKSQYQFTISIEAVHNFNRSSLQKIRQLLAIPIQKLLYVSPKLFRTNLQRKIRQVKFLMTFTCYLYLVFSGASQCWGTISQKAVRRSSDDYEQYQSTKPYIFVQIMYEQKFAIDDNNRYAITKDSHILFVHSIFKYMGVVWSFNGSCFPEPVMNINNTKQEKIESIEFVWTTQLSKRQGFFTEFTFCWMRVTRYFLQHFQVQSIIYLELIH